MLTLGMLESHSAYNTWIELEGIPAAPDTKLKGQPWWPKTAANPNGKNIRFLDFVWSDVMREQHPQVGESVQGWSSKLINRLDARKNKGNQKLDWIIYLMQTMQEGVLLVQKVLNLKASSLSNKIFNDFLGDVELYGDFPDTRGRATRLFHELMADIHAKHLEEFKDSTHPPEPQYTIIAHSLGTVMTLDAITYAHANIASRSSSEVSNDSSVQHFPGYDGQLFSCEDNLPKRLEGLSTTPPSLEWIRHLKSYVTLGSPIDKFLAMWTENYSHLNTTGWIDPTLLQFRESNKIRHFNYSDEQDPVGFELNILQSTPAWQALMENGEDVVFARYAVPGVAHVDYWNDYDLTHRILDVAIDNRNEELDNGKKPTGHYAEWFKLGAYIKGLFFSHVLAPIVGWAIATYLLQSFIEGWLVTKTISWLYLALFAVTLTITYVLMRLIILWRLLVVISRREESPLQEKATRKTADIFVRGLIYGTPILWAALIAISLAPSLQAWIAGWIGLTTWYVSIGLALLVSISIAYIHLSTLARWKTLKTTMARSFAEYI